MSVNHAIIFHASQSYFPPIECESEIKRCLFAVAEALIKLVCESENFEKDVLIQISNSIDDTNIELQKISEYMDNNFGKLSALSQLPHSQ